MKLNANESGWYGWCWHCAARSLVCEKRNRSTVRSL